MDPMDLLLQHVIASHDVNLYIFISICLKYVLVVPSSLRMTRGSLQIVFIASTTGHESVVAPMASHGVAVVFQIPSHLGR